MAGTDIAKREPNPLARAAIKGDLTRPEDHYAETTSLEEVAKALTVIEHESRPLNELFPGYRSLEPSNIEKAMAESAEVTGAAVEGIKMIGRKIMPMASRDQAMHWAGALIASLSDLPPMVLLPAIRDARHLPVPEPWKVEAAIRDAAVNHAARLSLARYRLNALRREIESANEPKLEPPPPLSEEEQIAGWHDFNAHMRRGGIRTRFFFGEESLDDDGNPVPDSLGNLRRLKEGEEDPADLAPTKNETDPTKDTTGSDQDEVKQELSQGDDE